MKTEIIKIDPEFPDIKHILHCAQVLRKGGLVIFPTETVYGIAADYNNEAAMARLREVKQRSEDKQFSVLISQKGLISNYTSQTDPAIYKLIDKYWPGPLTVVVLSKSNEGTIGVRMPDNNIALRLVQESQLTFAAPSANVQGKPPPKTCAEALTDLNELVDVAIDGGSAQIGLSSTVVDMTGSSPNVLRVGSVSSEDIEKTVKKKTVLFVCTGNSCRSVMAEYLFKSMTGFREDLDIISAGTGVFIQSGASAETISVLREEGLSAESHRSQPLTNILLKKADLIVVMTRSHRQQVLERVPSVEKRVYLLKEFANIPAGFQTDLDIQDPIGQDHQQYKQCLSVIKESLMRLRDLI